MKARQALLEDYRLAARMAAAVQGSATAAWRNQAWHLARRRCWKRRAVRCLLDRARPATGPTTSEPSTTLPRPPGTHDLQIGAGPDGPPGPRRRRRPAVTQRWLICRLCKRRAFTSAAWRRLANTRCSAAPALSPDWAVAEAPHRTRRTHAGVQCDRCGHATTLGRTLALTRMRCPVLAGLGPRPLRLAPLSLRPNRGLDRLGHWRQRHRVVN